MKFSIFIDVCIFFFSMAIETKNPKDQGIITNKKPYQRKLCDLTIVADHTFFEEVGQKSIDKTVLQMLWHVREANAMMQSEANTFSISYII